MSIPTITDWLMVGITLVYVIATIAIWFANHKSARATEKQLIESKRQFDETKRLEHMPYMQVSFGEWITSDERGSYLPNMWLDINRTADNHASSSGMSIDVTNIGLGLAVNLKCQWISGEIKQEQHLSASLLKKEECCTSTFIISAAVANKKDSRHSLILQKNVDIQRFFAVSLFAASWHRVASNGIK